MPRKRAIKSLASRRVWQQVTPRPRSALRNNKNPLDVVVPAVLCSSFKPFISYGTVCGIFHRLIKTQSNIIITLVTFSLMVT